MKLTYPTVPPNVLKEMSTSKFIEGVRDDTLGNALLPNTDSTASLRKGHSLMIP